LQNTIFFLKGKKTVLIQRCSRGR